MVERMRTMDIFEHNDFMFAVSTFLDDFKKCTDKYSLIKDEPNGIIADKFQLCLLAAIIHKLSNEHGMTPPLWISSPEYIMPYPVFAHGTVNKEYQRYLIETTPPEFSSRNIFYGANVTERV